MMQKNLLNAYEKLDHLRERLEFSGLKKECDILEEAREELNRYLAVVEKFDRTGKKKFDE
jgi:alpha-amylase/alpha-mannosidase (GH57 family)